MENKRLDGGVTLREAVKRYPRVLPALQQLGICCVNPDNENMTISELCERFGAEQSSFLAAVNAMLNAGL